MATFRLRTIWSSRCVRSRYSDSGANPRPPPFLGGSKRSRLVVDSVSKRWLISLDRKIRKRKVDGHRRKRLVEVEEQACVSQQAIREMAWLERIRLEMDVFIAPLPTDCSELLG